MHVLSKGVVFGDDFNSQFVPVSLGKVPYKEQQGEVVIACALFLTTEVLQCFR